MKLPRAEDVIVPKQKLTNYLLALEHEAGGNKARFFFRFGFERQNWRLLARALKRHASENDVVGVRWISQGQLYVVEGPLSTPVGVRPGVRSIWMIRHDEVIPSLTTAYPFRRVKP